jgi:outer membrane protein OmpA-like peptidoglycan-associated protein
LFGTFSVRTLRRGEWTAGLFWNNFDRDIGDIDVNQIPLNFTFGLTNQIEVFANLYAFQQVTTRQPFLLSGSNFNFGRIKFGGRGADPIRAFGPPQPRGGGAAFFPGTRSLVGGILPSIGAFAGNFPGFKPFDMPGYYNDFPFFPFMDLRGPRMSSNGLGDFVLGLKRAFTDPDNWFSVGAAGIVRLPSARSYQAMANGRTTGAVDGGPMVIFSQHWKENKLRFHQNIGYMFTGSIERNDIKLLDRRNELLLNAGAEFAPNKYVVYTAELNSKVFVGNGTPNLNPVNPVDLVLGARFFLLDGKVQFGGGWRKFVNNADDRIYFSEDPVPILVRSDDANGFVVHFGIGRRRARVIPPPPNRPPIIAALESDKDQVVDGEPINFTCRATDPDGDFLIYTWDTSAGRITGSGANTTLNTRGINPNPGSPPARVTVTCMVDDGRGGTASASKPVTIVSPTPPPPPPPRNRPPEIQSIDITVVGTPLVEGQFTDGDMLSIRGVATDPDNDPLTYTWTSSTGAIIGTGPQVRLNTTGLTAGPGAPPVNVTFSLRVDDGRGGSDSDSRTVTVNSVKKPEAIKVGDLLFPVNNARINNEHKAILDDVATRLVADPRARLYIDGHADRGERRNISRQRAENAKAYLVNNRQIDPNRITVRDFGTTRPHPSGDRKLNRRVELWIVPEGADIPQ